jgi:hypothetical protein
VFFFNQYRIIPELHGFEPGDYRREYLKGVAMLIVSFVLWIGLFSIGPILKAWDNRHESRATGSVGDEPAEAVERPEDKFRAGP